MTDRNQGNNEQTGNQPTQLETSAHPGHNAVASDKLDRTILDARDLAPKDVPDAGQLEAFGDDETITDRVRTNLGRELHADHLARLNINTQALGVVYLRGPVFSQEQSVRIEQIVKETKGVNQVVNELHIEQNVGTR